MKVQIGTREIKVKEVEIELPMYAMIEEEDFVSYIKIDTAPISTENLFIFQIKIGINSTELIRYMDYSCTIDGAWIENKCSKEDWEEQLKGTKTFLSKF